MKFRRVGVALVMVTACFLATFAMPVQVWRTGRMAVPPLTLTAPPVSTAPSRVWIDTDAACGYTPRTDVDDCLAIWLLLRRQPRAIAGVSTVFGNAALSVTDSITRELVRLLTGAERSRRIDVFRGSPAGLEERASGNEPAHRALADVLNEGPLTIVALGPVTNIVHTLRRRPELARNVERVVAVMGRRPGHLFHPSEGSGRGSFLGHGPVFRDFNFSIDRRAARELVDMRVAVTLVPYDAATNVQIAERDLERLAGDGDAGAWIAERSHGWLDYWQSDIGRDGFYPFDLMAAAYIEAPSLFRCASVEASVGTDPLAFVPLLRQEALLVDEGDGESAEHVWYCPAVQSDFDERLRMWLTTE